MAKKNTKKKTSAKKNTSVFTRTVEKFGSLHKPLQVLLLAVVVGIIGGSSYAVYASYAAKPVAGTSSISIATPAPYHLGDTMQFNTSVEKLAGWEYPMVAVACYQDVNGDGKIEHGYPWTDVVYTQLDKPGTVVTLGGYSSIWTQRGGGPAECDAQLAAYGWKGGVQSVRILASVSFNALDKQ